MSDIKFAYGTTTALTLTVASLATDTSLLAGRESDLVDNSSNNYLDFLVAGKISVGTTPTSNTAIEVWAWGAHDASAYPDTITGADSNRSLTARTIVVGTMRPVQILSVDSATSNRGYYFGPVSLASLFGGVAPLKWGIWLVHNTAVALNSTGGNHYIKYTPIYATSV